MFNLSRLRTPHKAVAAMFILNGALFGAWASRIPSIQHSFELSPKELGLFLLLLAAGAISAFPMSGYLCDRIGTKQVTMICALAYCPTLVLIGISPDITTLAISIFLFGAAHGAMDVSMNGWGAEVEKRLGHSIMSNLHAMFSIGAGVGAGFGAIITSSGLDYTLHFIIFPVILLPLIGFSHIQWQAAPTIKKAQSKKFVMPKGSLLVVAIVAFSCAVGEGAMADWSAVFLNTVIEATLSESALGYTIFSIAMVIMRLLGDTIITRLGAVRTIQFCGTAAFLGAVVITTSDSLATSYLGLVFLGMGYSIVMPLVFSKAASSDQLSLGTAIASVAIFAYGGMLLGPPLIGFIAELFSLRAAFQLFIVLALVVFLGATAFRAKKSSHTQNEKQANTLTER